MSLVLDYGLDSQARALLILVLSMKDGTEKKEMDRLHIQKTIRYYEHLQQEERIDFSNFKYGGVSDELHENLETLEECGLIDRTGSPRNPKFVLTEEGKEAAKELLAKYSESDLKKLEFAKIQLNNLGYDETLYLMYMLIPETQKHSIEFNRLDRKKETLIPSLFLKGCINSATAARWLGLSEKAFLDSISSSKSR